MFFFDALNRPYLPSVETDGSIDTAVWTFSHLLLNFIAISNIFFSKENEFLLIDLYSSKIFIG